MGLGGRGGRREKLQSGRSGGFQLLGKGGWSGRQGDRGAAGPTSGPVPNVTASVLPSDAHRTVRTEDDNQGSGRHGWAFQRVLLWSRRGKPLSYFVCGARHPVGLRSPGVGARPSTVLPARVLHWPTSLVPHRVAQNRLVLTSWVKREFHVLCSQRSPRPLDTEAPWVLPGGDSWRLNRPVKQRGVRGIWTQSLGHQLSSDNL